MLQPARTKYRKVHKSRNRGLSYVANQVSFGDFGLKATTHGHLTSRQIEAARRCMSRYAKRGGKLHIRIFPDQVQLDAHEPALTPNQTDVGEL